MIIQCLPALCAECGGLFTDGRDLPARLECAPLPAHRFGAQGLVCRWETPGQQPLAAEDECVVCMAAVHDCICIPCGHRAMCGPCASAVVQHTGLCPICRTPVERTLQVPC